MEQDSRVIVLRGGDGRDVTIPRDQVEELAPSPKSLMPEGPPRGLGEAEARDFIAYLRSSQPPK